MTNIKKQITNHFNTMPDAKGFYDNFGGSYVPPNIQEELDKINTAYLDLKDNPDFIKELQYIRKHFQGRPTPITYASNLTKYQKGGKIYLKREDLNHTGAHKLNHCMGEALLAKYMGKKKLIAETGAGQHGVALATAAAYFGMECEIHMGEIDIEKEKPNVIRMKILGATVIPVKFGAKTLKEAVDSAFNAYIESSEDTFYAIGSVVGPHPFPMMVRDFQKIVGIEAKEQFMELTGKLPDFVVACVGGGSNAIGIYQGFMEHSSVKLFGVEPLGKSKKTGEHAATLTYGKEGQIHGFNTIVLKDRQTGEPAPVYSIASGLDYPGVGPEHAYFHKNGIVKYDVINDKECIDSFYRLSRLEGIIPALESSHAVAYAEKLAKENPKSYILVNLSGRGDKDVDFVYDKYPL